MKTVRLESETDFDGWRDAARHLLQADTQPSEVQWDTPESQDSLFSDSSPGSPKKELPSNTFSVTKAFIEIAQLTVCHRDPERFARLYKVLFRLQSDRALLFKRQDPDVAWLNDCAKAIRRDIHKTHAFVRFRACGVDNDDREQFAAWFEPRHRSLKLSAPFFKRRFPNMNWMVVTPDTTAIWNGISLSFGEGGSRADVPAEDAIEDSWRAYYRSIFNPARVKINAMTAEMPKSYWKNLPEASDIASLLNESIAQTRNMSVHGVSTRNPNTDKYVRHAAEQTVFHNPDNLSDLAKALNTCRKCPLYKDASQAVPGEGPVSARIMIVGEQPGDAEDIGGRPFIGPAGQVLNSGLSQAGINRNDVYVTNAVKHFKFSLRGKKRIHSKPRAGEIEACKWWLETERKLVKPRLIIALGNSAARAVLGQPVKIGAVRGQIIQANDGPDVIATYHPSYLLRLNSETEKRKAWRAFVQDLAKAKKMITEEMENG